MTSRASPVWAFVRVAALVASLSGCQGGSGDAPLAAPADFTVLPSDDAYLTRVVFRWSPVADAEAYALDAQLGEGAWRSAGSIPARQGGRPIVGAAIDFTAQAPEGATFSFRLRATRGSRSSPASAVAKLDRGVHPAASLTVTEADGGGPLQLAWSRTVVTDSAVALDRAIVPHDGLQGPWVEVVGIPPYATDFTDTVDAWVDGAQVVYRLRLRAGTRYSEPVHASSRRARPLAPVGLTAASAGPTSIALTWTPRSTYASQQVVTRVARGTGQWVQLPPLPPTADGLVDEVPVAGAYTYTVRAQVGTDPFDPWSVAAGAPVAGFTALAPAFPYAVSSPSLPPGFAAARDSHGRFGLLALPPGDSSAVAFLPGETGWARHEVPASDALLARIRFDAVDRPHLFTRLYDAPGWNLRHERLDAGGWAVETSTRWVVDVALDADGAVHAVWCDENEGLGYLSNESGAWTEAPIHARFLPGSCRIAVGPSGEPVIAYGAVVDQPGDVQTFHLAWLHREAGAWVDEAIPGTEGVQAPLSNFLAILQPTPSQTVIVYEQYSWGDTPSLVRAVVRDGAAWGPVEAVGERAYGSTRAFAAAADPASGRILVAWNGAFEGHRGAPGVAALRAAGGGWSLSTLLDAPSGLEAGFTPAGKAWVLEGLGGPSYLLYEER